MNTAYMSYFESLAKLARVANKQTLFLMHILYRMKFDKEAKQWIASITASEKRKILKAIGSESKDPLRTAAQYIKTLKNAGLIKPMGGGAYLVNPEYFSGAKYVPQNLRTANGVIYETRAFAADGGIDATAYIVTADGERIDL